MEGSIINQVEISGFLTEKEAEKFRKKIKSFKSVFHLSKMDKTLQFLPEEASWKMKEDFSLVYLFLTDDTYPEKEISSLSQVEKSLSIRHLIISPSGEGDIIFYDYENGNLSEKKEVKGGTAQMLGDLVKGGFK